MAARKLLLHGQCGLYATTKSRIILTLRPLCLNNLYAKSTQIGISRCYHEDTENTSDKNTDDKPIRMQLFNEQYKRPFWELRWLTSFVNHLYVNHFYQGFTSEELYEGCSKAVEFISNHIADGDFDSLEGLVEEQTLNNLRHRFTHLTEREKASIPLNEDLTMRSISQFEYKNDSDNNGYVSLLFIVTSVKAAEEEKGMTTMKLCQYCFKRNLAPDSDWIVTKLNHLVNEFKSGKMFRL